MAVFPRGWNDDVLGWRSVRDLRVDLEDHLAHARSQMFAEEEERYLSDCIAAMDAELAEEDGYRERVDAFVREIPDASQPGLKGLYADFMTLMLERYRIRKSVVELYAASRRARDAVIARAFTLAGLTALPGGGYFATGKDARGEAGPAATIQGMIILEGAEERQWRAGIHRFRDILAAAGVPLEEWGIPLFTLQEWRGDFSTAAATFSAFYNVQTPAYADMRLVAGDEEAVAPFPLLVRAALSFRHLIRENSRIAATLPVALGFMGRLRVERQGVHRGALNLRDLGIKPLAATVRMLALYHDVPAVSTLDRLRELLMGGHLDVRLADSAAFAFLHISHLHSKGQLPELRPGQEGYVQPEFFTPEEERLLRESLETVETLQKLLYARCGGYA